LYSHLRELLTLEQKTKYVKASKIIISAPFRDKGPLTFEYTEGVFLPFYFNYYIFLLETYIKLNKLGTIKDSVVIHQKEIDAKI